MIKQRSNDRGTSHRRIVIDQKAAKCVMCNACSISVFDLTPRNCKINTVDLVRPVFSRNVENSKSLTESKNTLSMLFFETRLPMTSFDPLEGNVASLRKQ